VKPFFARNTEPLYVGLGAIKPWTRRVLVARACLVPALCNKEEEKRQLESTQPVKRETAYGKMSCRLVHFEPPKKCIPVNFWNISQAVVKVGDVAEAL
jgi:hypothetical protein